MTQVAFQHLYWSQDAGSTRQESARSRDSRPGLQVATRGVTALAVVVAVLCLVSGCSGSLTKPEGYVGVSARADGSPVIIIIMCRARVDALNMYESSQRARTERAEPVASWTADSAVADFDEVDVTAASPAGWKVREAFRPQPGTTYTAIAFAQGRKARVGPVTFTSNELAGLDPARVRYTTGETNRTSFRAELCR